jgi:hypothetical protein
MSQEDYAQQSKEKLEQLLRRTQDRNEAKKIADELKNRYVKELIDLANSPSTRATECPRSGESEPFNIIKQGNINKPEYIPSKKEEQRLQNDKKSLVPIVIFILAVIYVISPIDILPDLIPGVGWFDDILFIVGSGLNLIEKNWLQSNTLLQSILRTINRIVIILGIIAVLIIALAVLVTYKVAV